MQIGIVNVIIYFALPFKLLKILKSFKVRGGRLESFKAAMSV